MKLYEVLDRDPRTAQLANNGQARITNQEDEKTRAELRAELETFVCEGQFGNAVQLVLERFLGNLGHTKQDSAWVSGFFGSGKSHLLKMLTHLWVNTDFDGASARSLPRGGLPDEVEAQLRELDTQARRTGVAPIAAAGTLLGGTDRVRETVLSILLRATGWPVQYPQAKFCFWLREQGHLDAVRSSIADAGRPWEKELNNLYVSPHIRQALLRADPDLAPNEKEVGRALQSQFPQLTADITTAEFVAAAREALRGEDGQLPLTLLVLDEVQQYINEASDRAATITEVAEAVQTQFDSRIMLVGAGQSSLSGGTQALMWLRDRFKITIELADADVEAVTRKVLLRKKPSAEPEVESVLEANSGEIARHLRDTKIGQRSEDRRFRVGDYPLLPTRRRFWEACFQAADAAGTHSQLRSQLRILHDSLHQIAERELGSVLPASDLFNALAPALVNTGVLLNEINTKIQKLDDGSDDGRLRRDLCGLVFLVGKLPREAGVDMGVRATSSVLADLMVDDVTRDSGPFRKLVADTLESLADTGTLMKVGEEFRLQTTEGAEWDGAFRQKQTAIRQSEIEISTRRDHLFGAQVQGVLGEVKLTHGAAKLRRSISLHVGGEPPTAGGDHVSVWLRDGWSCSEKDFISDARRLGQEDPTLHVFLPKRSADQLKDRIIDAEAARQVLDHYGVPASPEGQEARDGMESRLRVAEQSRDEIVHEIIRASKVLRGGGAEVYGDGLLEKIKDGANSSLARLFPRFDDGDHRGWEAALKRAKDGSDEPLKVAGWDQSTEEHPVAKAVLGKVGSGARGSDVQKELKAAPFGWPQDAIDAVLIALHRSNHLRVTKNGQAVPLGALDQGSIKSAEFRPERVRLTTKQRIELRGLFDKVGVKARTGEEEVRAPMFLEALVALADRTGGGPPLPPVPDKGLIMELGQKAGSEQLAAILEHQDDIKAWICSWTLQADRCSERMPTWQSATALREHARGLPVEVEVGPELDAIHGQRSLLSDSDHATPLKAKLATALREELANRHGELCAEVERAQAALKADATWAKLSADEQGEVLKTVGLGMPGALCVDDDGALQRELDRQPVSGWQSALDAVPQRLAKALQEAASRAKAAGTPTVTLSVRRGTLPDEGAVRAWLSEHEAKLLAAIAKGPVIIN